MLLDRTATVDFQLKESTVELEAIVVTADLDPVQMDVSYAQQAITQDQLESIPVGPRIRDQIATQVGLDTDAWGIAIRGEDATAIGFNMDGVTHLTIGTSALTRRFKNRGQASAGAHGRV